jgi:hypothetical protein
MKRQMHPSILTNRFIATFNQRVPFTGWGNHSVEAMLTGTP